MLSLGFVNSEYKYCLYVKVTKEYKSFILLDDLLLAGTNDKEIENTKRLLKENFKMKDLGNVRQFLGMSITQNIKRGKIAINQSMYNIWKLFCKGLV